jgi:hypothetical protein
LEKKNKTLPLTKSPRPAILIIDYKMLIDNTAGTEAARGSGCEKPQKNTKVKITRTKKEVLK